MSGSDPPYLYDGPSNRHVAYPYSNFDPKAASRASWAASVQAAQPRPKQQGPLLDFNKHPDSYIIVTGSQAEHKPMSPKVKTWIKAMRWVQFALRVLQLLGAAGTLVCVICVRKAPTAQGWIMRVPPAWDVVLLLYGVYHLVRPAKSRTPASSASYHIFAMIMDGGLIPFYVFIALFANQNYTEPADTEGRWQSFFSEGWSTNQLLLATWLTATVMAGLHLISIAFDIYLIIMFRKIARLPPDMNPLEDNLTSRRIAKHQYKNSEASVSTFSMTEKPGHMSSSTVNLPGNRFSGATTDDRAVAFRHSRMGSDLAFSPHNPDTARLSRQQYDAMYRQGTPNRGSRQSFVGHARSPSASPSKRGSYIEEKQLPPMPSASDRYHNGRPDSFASAYPARLSSPAPNAAPTNAAVESQQQESLLNDNWYTLEDRPVTRGSAPPSPGLKTPTRHLSPVPNFSRPSPEPSPVPFREPRLPSLSPEPEIDFMPQPLRMNPPTPPIDESQQFSSLAHRRVSLHDTVQPRRVSYHETTPEPRRINLHDSNQPRRISHHTPVPSPRHASYHNSPKENYESHLDSDNEDAATITNHTAERQTLTNSAINRSLTVTSTAAASSIYSDHDDALPTKTAASSLYSDPPNRAPLNEVAVNRSLTATSHTTANSSLYSESAPSLDTSTKTQTPVVATAYAQPSPHGFTASPGVKSAGTPKGRAYGDLSAAMRGIRGQGGAYAPLPLSPERQSQGGYAPSPPRHGGGRVVSRSGADIADEALFMPEKSGRRRLVSGKVAEEGLAGGRW